jgi:hypothetical protein
MIPAIARCQRARALALFALICVCSLPLLALEAKEGLVKIIVDEVNARVSLYRLVDIAKNRYEPFLYDQDPRTTFATLSVDGKQAKLGDASDYRFTVKRTETGVNIEFRSSFCVVTEAIEFARSNGSALADGVRFGFVLENVSERDAALGLRLLVDTWLAEKSGLHFATNKSERINTETEITRSTGEVWIATQGEKARFMIQLSGSGIDSPDRVLLANWKRLADATWGLEPNSQRNFTLIPYSINDSAAALYWEPVAVPRGSVRRIAIAMGSFNENGYAIAQPRTATEELFEATVLGDAEADPAIALSTDLVAARDLITRIDFALATGNATPDEIAAWKKILDRLEERKKGY